MKVLSEMPEFGGFTACFGGRMFALLSGDNIVHLKRKEKGADCKKISWIEEFCLWTISFNVQAGNVGYKR